MSEIKTNRIQHTSLTYARRDSDVILSKTVTDTMLEAHYAAAALSRNLANLQTVVRGVYTRNTVCE